MITKYIPRSLLTPMLAKSNRFRWSAWGIVANQPRMVTAIAYRRTLRTRS
jgi:hypothetical protein